MLGFFRNPYVYVYLKIPWFSYDSLIGDITPVDTPVKPPPLAKSSQKVASRVINNLALQFAAVPVTSTTTVIIYVQIHMLYSRTNTCVVFTYKYICMYSRTNTYVCIHVEIHTTLI